MMLDVSKGFVMQNTHIPFEAICEIPPQDIIGETVSYEPAELSGTFTVTEDTILLKGQLICKVHGTCSLCAAPVEEKIELEFSEIFRRNANELEEEAFSYEGKQIDLNKPVMTLLLLNTPIRFTCDADHSTERQYLGNVEESPHPEETEDAEQPTYRPFEHLAEQLKQQ